MFFYKLTHLVHWYSQIYSYLELSLLSRIALCQLFWYCLVQYIQCGNGIAASWTLTCELELANLRYLYVWLHKNEFRDLDHEHEEIDYDPEYDQVQHHHAEDDDETTEDHEKHRQEQRRRRIKTEEKAKVVAARGTELIQFLVALAIFYQDDLMERLTGGMDAFDK